MGGGKGGKKRGRTQRRHFRQGRDNTWKYGNKKTRSDEDDTVEDPSANSNYNPSWEPFLTENSGFEEYYKGQAIVPEEEWEDFITLLRKPLPAAFRINGRFEAKEAEIGSGYNFLQQTAESSIRTRVTVPLEFSLHTASYWEIRGLLES